MTATTVIATRRHDTNPTAIATEKGIEIEIAAVSLLIKRKKLSKLEEQHQ